MTKSEVLTDRYITVVEHNYHGTFIGDFCIKDATGNWINEPIAVFYQPNPNIELGHSNYFGIFFRGDTSFICKADSAFDKPIAAFLDDNGEYVYSRYRHDYRVGFVNGNETYIDGARDYTRSNAAKLVYLIIDKDKLVIKNV